jgi:hypothetical protein
MNDDQIKALINRLRKSNVVYHYNSDEDEDGTLWIGNISNIDFLDIALIKTYEEQIKQYFKYNMRDLL